MAGSSGSSTSRIKLNYKTDSTSIEGGQQIILSKNFPTDPNVYKMMERPRGFCLLLNNVNYIDKKLYRRGAINDERKLESLFTDLFFEVIIGRNLNKKDFLDKINLVANDARNATMDCLIMVIMSHGWATPNDFFSSFIRTVEGAAVKIMEILEIFEHRRNPILRGKPKICMINACRGSSAAEGHLLDGDNHDGGAPDLREFHIVFSSCPGFGSLRNISRGSYFVSSLEKVFKEECYISHFNDLMIAVENDVQKVRSESSKEEKTYATQHLNTINFAVSKKLFFNPGLPILDEDIPRKRQKKVPAPKKGIKRRGKKTAKLVIKGANCFFKVENYS